VICSQYTQHWGKWQWLLSCSFTLANNDQPDEKQLITTKTYLHQSDEKKEAIGIFSKLFKWELHKEWKEAVFCSAKHKAHQHHRKTLTQINTSYEVNNIGEQSCTMVHSKLKSSYQHNYKMTATSSWVLSVRFAHSQFTLNFFFSKL